MYAFLCGWCIYVLYLCPLTWCGNNDITVAMSTLRVLVSKYHSYIKEGRTSWKKIIRFQDWQGKYNMSLNIWCQKVGKCLKNGGTILRLPRTQSSNMELFEQNKKE